MDTIAVERAVVVSTLIADPRASAEPYPLPSRTDPQQIVGERFELRRQLGTGGFGVVYEAYDCHTGSTVALKLLQRYGPDAILGFKREFRALQEVQHRNLVQLHELIERQGHWLLSMELVHGSDLIAYVRGDHATTHDGGGAQFDAARLRHAFSQLAQGLIALHAAGQVHRDIKPSNVLVSQAGRAVLLDFGLVTQAGAANDSAVQPVVGTASYMAPEQAAGEPLTPATDWYAVGVILYEALTGRLPYEGNSLQVMMAKQSEPIAAPAEFNPAVPADLNALCLSLLNVSVSQRPGGHEVLDALGSERPPSSRPPPLGTPDSRTLGARFVGRERELSHLADGLAAASEGRLATCYVHGESGMGKTCLVDHFCRTLRVERDDVLILRSRCRENETLAYKALDGIVDVLSQELKQLPPATCRALLPRQAGLLPLVFPVMGRVTAVTEMSASTHGAQDKLSLRALVFTALRELFGRVAEHRPLMLVIDDLQWADAESLALLQELLREPDPPCMFVVATGRAPETCSDAVAKGIAAFVRAGDRDRTLPLTALPPDAAMNLARGLMDNPDDERARAVAQAAEGHPMFVEALVRYAQAKEGGEVEGQDADSRRHSLDEALRYYVQTFSPEAQQLLEICCVAGVQLPQGSLCELVDLPPEEFTQLLARLRVARLLRTHHGVHHDAVEPFHDRVRTAVARNLPKSRAVSVHLQIAQTLQEMRFVDREQLAQHWHLAGQHDRAAQNASIAGDQASDNLAFDKAARMYRWAMELGEHRREERHRLLVKLAEALVNAGHCSDAADTFLEAVESATAVEAIDLRRRAAENFIHSGRLAQGIEVANVLLRSVNLKPIPETTAKCVREMGWWTLKRWLRGSQFTARSAREIPLELLTKVDVLWSLSAAFGPTDHIKAAALQGRHFLLALDAGDKGRLAQAMALDVFSLYFRGKHAQVPIRLAQARTLAEESADPDARAWVDHVEAQAAVFDTDSARAEVALEATVKMLSTQCTGAAWRIGSAQASLLLCSLEAGHWTKFLRSYPMLMRQLSERGDPFARAQALFFASYAYHLMRDDLAEAHAALDEALESTDTLSARYQCTIARRRISVYEGDTRSAEQLLEQQEQLYEVAGQGGSAVVSVHATVPLVMAALEVARRDPSQSRARVRQARRELRRARRATANSRLAQAKSPMLIEAAIDAHLGDVAGALDLLTEIEACCRNAGSGLHAAVASAKIGELIGGEAGQKRLQVVHQELAEVGVKKPLRFLAAMVPGVLVLD